MTNEELMRRAIELSENSVKSGGGPFGAVIARDGEIIAEGSNNVTIDMDPTAHAESLQEIRNFRLEWLCYLYFMRALPDVFRCYLLGTSRKDILCKRP